MFTIIVVLPFELYKLLNNVPETHNSERF